MINIVLADDHQIIIDGISNLLTEEADIDIVAECNNGQEVLDCLKKSKPHLVLLDLDMPIMNGLECAQKARENYPDVKIAILTMHEEKALIQKFIALGVQGYFLKTIKKKELIHAIRTIADGEEYFPSAVTKALVSSEKEMIDVTQSPLLGNLTSRELEIIKLVAQGSTNKEIGDQLHISPRTADTHRSNLMRKLNLKNVADLVRFAFQNKLIS